MDTVGAYEAKTHLPRLLERVSKGESFTITKHGVPVAVLQPFETEKKSNTETVIANIIEFRKTKRLSGLSIREMIEAGRR